MSKLLSIVVPYYNQPENLQDLLDLLHAQSLRQMEIIIVDDCSEKSPEHIIHAMREKGLTIHYIRQPKRRYTLQARLAGMKKLKVITSLSWTLTTKPICQIPTKKFFNSPWKSKPISYIFSPCRKMRWDLTFQDRSQCLLQMNCQETIFLRYGLKKAVSPIPYGISCILKKSIKKLPNLSILCIFSELKIFI